MGTVRQSLMELGERVAPTLYPETPFQRAGRRMPIVLWRLGLGRVAGRTLILLTVTGRSSGLPRRTPVRRELVGDAMYVWCPYGDRAQWYRNLIASPVATVQSHRGTQVVRAVPVEDDEVVPLVAELRRVYAPLLRCYLASEGIADTPGDLVRNRERLHVRRLDPTSQEGPPALEPDLVWLWLVPAALAALRVARATARGTTSDERSHATR